MRSPPGTKHTPNNTRKRAGATSHTYRLWRHVLRPSTGGARTGAIAYGGGLKPCCGRAPELLREPSRGRGEGPARASLAATCSRPAPAQASRSMPRWLRSQPRRQPAAQRRHSSTLGSRARRPRGGDAARKPASRADDRAVPASESRCKLIFAASEALRISRRRGQGLRGHGGLGRLIFCTCLHTPAQASRSQVRRDPARPLRLAADAAMFAWQALLPLSAAAKAAMKITGVGSRSREGRSCLGRCGR